MDSRALGQLAPKAIVLLIIGEPFSEEEKAVILDEIGKGFRSWDVESTGININEELAQIAGSASLESDSANASSKPGERVIQNQTENLALEILVNPFAQTVKQSVKKLLTAPAPTKYIIYSGHVFQGSGAWLLQDDTFAFSNFSQVLKNIDVENALKQNTAASLTIYTLADNVWETGVNRTDFTTNIKVQVNPSEKLNSIHGVMQFVAYLGGFVTVIPLTRLLQASEQFGNISFSRPTLYIFPGCQGDSALFGISGFNLLVNGGYNRRACFWDFARHLDRVDALLMTHLGPDNIFGLKTILQRKSLENVHPQIGYLYFNVLERIGALQADEEKNTDSREKKSLLINLSEEANKITQMARQLGINPHPCARNASPVSCEPINLYHKLGHGSLDMYILNPVTDSKELKEFYQQLSKEGCSFGNSGLYPLQNVLSVCSLLVWKPFNVDDRIVRILFPGNAPQHKILEGFEKVKTFDFLKRATCTARDLAKPPSIKKPAAAGPGKSATGGKAPVVKGPLSSKIETRKNLNTTRPESPSKEDRAVVEKSNAKPLSPTKSVKSLKDDGSKKSLKVSDKPKGNDKETHVKSPVKDEKVSKIMNDSRSITVPSPVRGTCVPSTMPDPTTCDSSTKSLPPLKLAPIKSETKTKITASAEELALEAVAEASPAGQRESDDPLVGHLDQNSLEPKPEQADLTHLDTFDSWKISDDKISEARDAVGAVDDASVAELSSVDKLKHQNFGIYDEEPEMNGEEARDKYELEEQEKPQALPEPSVMVESPGHASEGLSDYGGRTDLHQQEVFESGSAEEKQTFGSSGEPVPEIPSSPEISHEEHQVYFCPSSEKRLSEFETLTFTNDDPDLSSSSRNPPVEQNIQYGINNSSYGRDMGGIQEVDEDEHDDDGSVTREVDTQKEGSLDREALREMGIYDEDYESDEEIDQDQEKEEEVGSTYRTSAERQFEDVDEVTYQEHQSNAYEQDRVANNSSLPVSVDKDFDPDLEDRDSIDGGTPDDEQNVDEMPVSKTNGDVNQITEDVSAVACHRLMEEATSLNPFIGVDNTNVGQQALNKSLFDDEDCMSGSSFDPLKQWGQPMGLPSPPLRTSPNSSEKQLKAGKVDGKKRAATAPAASRPAPRPGSAPKKFSATGSSRSSPLNSKTPTLPPMTPFYVDLTYVPCHADSLYADIEFFKRIRARYYVISALSPNPQVLDSLLEAKVTWEQKDLEVTIIPTYDNETLRHWMCLNVEKLQELRVDLKPAVSRCTIQLQDLETSLPAYRLEV